MKTKIFMALAAVLAMGALIFGYAQMRKERVADAAADQPVTAASRAQTDANGGTVITLDSKTQELIGLQTATLAAATLPPERKAYGRVLDSAALVALQNDAAAARSALQAAQREYDRLKKLSAEDNASARALETAEVEMRRAQSALATAEAQLLAAAGKAVAGMSPDFFQSLARQECVLVRLDLPAGETAGETPASAQILLPGAELPIVADCLGHAATADPQAQGEGFILAVTNAPATLAPGLAVTGFLQLPGEPLHGVVLPDNAVVRSDGRAWIYVQTGETNFARREIALDQPDAGGWFVTNGVAAGDKLVVTGAQTLLSEEHKTEIKMGD